MSRAIIIVADSGTEYIGSAEYVEGRLVIDGDGYMTLYDPLRITVASDGANFRSLMTPPGSFDWTSKTRYHYPAITDAGPIATARYAANVEEYKKQYENQKEPEKKVKTPKLLVGIR